MPEIETGLMDLLSADAPLAGLVATRIWPSDRLPDDNIYPALCFWSMSNSQAGTMQGFAQTTMSVYQFHFYATQLADVKAIRHRVIKALMGYSGTTASGVTIQAILPVHNGDRQILWTDTTLLYGWEVEAQIFWNEDYSGA